MNPASPVHEKTPLELLAPARTAEIGRAAIDHGADAVYIGASRFSARAAADNAIEDIAGLVAYAHLYDARVYVALNTILTDVEISEAKALIDQLHLIHVDGLIIQDMGLLELELPPIPLIASTQTHNTTPEKVAFLEAVGFKRVILARELTLQEIKAIRGQTQVELEVFVHGALCVSYSGQCYLSQAITQRSGNRGVCAQACRSRFDLIDGDGRVVIKDKYLLSQKDLNLLNHIPDLAAAGITSFKIEGRYKDRDYVKNVTACYRIAIDRFISMNPQFQKSSTGVTTHLFTPDLEKTFNRGYTTYFLKGRNEKTGSIDTQKSIGKFVGKVTQTGTTWFTLEGETLINGDGLCFFNQDRDISGFRIDRVEQGRLFPNALKGLTVGTRLYRNHDQTLARKLNKPSAYRKIDVVMHFLQERDIIHLYVEDENGNRISTQLDVLYETAKDPERMKTHIHDQLLRTGNTPYQVSMLNISPERPGFLPVRILNQLRRTALEALTEERIARNRQSGAGKPLKKDVAFPENELDFRANVLNALARRFYERHGAVIKEPALEKTGDPAGKQMMVTRYCILHQIDRCPRYNRKTEELKRPLHLRDSTHQYTLHVDCERCHMTVVY